jgi:hypothetical protein
MLLCASTTGTHTPEINTYPVEIVALAPSKATVEGPDAITIVPAETTAAELRSDAAMFAVPMPADAVTTAPDRATTVPVPEVIVPADTVTAEPASAMLEVAV